MVPNCQTWVQNWSKIAPIGSQIAPKWLPGGLRAALGCRGRFLSDFWVHLGLRFGSKKVQKLSRNLVENQAPVLNAVLGHLGASWGQFWGRFWGHFGVLSRSPARKPDFVKNVLPLAREQDVHGSGGVKQVPKTWARFLNMLGSILGPNIAPQTWQKTS